MPRYVIQRDLPGAGALSAGDLAAVARKSNDVLGSLGSGITWIQSYVTPDRLYCIYDSSNTDLIEEHARRGGFPCDRIEEVIRIIDPFTARP